MPSANIVWLWKFSYLFRAFSCPPVLTRTPLEQCEFAFLQHTKKLLPITFQSAVEARAGWKNNSSPTLALCLSWVFCEGSQKHFIILQRKNFLLKSSKVLWLNFTAKNIFLGISDNKSTNFLNSKYDTTRTDDKSFRSNQSSTLFRVKMETAKNDETIESL